MGRERTRSGKHLYLCLASLIFLPFLGCAALQSLQQQPDSREPLVYGRRLVAQGDYERAIKENQKSLSLSAQRDEALFNLGLIHAHYGNPKKDYAKSLGFFEELVRDHPRSPWVEQAKIWVGVLQENEKLHQENQKLTQVIEGSKRVDIEIEELKREKAR